MKYILPFLLLLPSLCFAISESDFAWRIREEKKGTTIFEADRHEATGIVPIKAQTHFNYSMPIILSVISDTPKKKDWVPNLSEGYIVDQISKYERVEYARYDSPWPFNDRVFVIRTKGIYNKKENSVKIEIRSIEHPKTPHNKDHVRGQTHIGNVFMKAVGPNKTFFEIVLLTDFKGNIPTWIINMVQRKWPYKMFKLLRKQLAKPDIKVLDIYKSYNP